MIHHCNGCCTSIEQTRKEVYACILNSGLLLGDDTDMPRLDRWGSSTRTVAKVCGGMMFHGILQRVGKKAFPSWASGAKPEAPDPDDQGSVEDYRRMCRSKVWRMGKVLQDPKREVQFIVLSWTAEALDPCGCAFSTWMLVAMSWSLVLAPHRLFLSAPVFSRW